MKKINHSIKLNLLMTKTTMKKISYEDNKMKKYNLLILSLMIFLVSINGVFAGSQTGVALVSQSPDPAVAGDLVELRISVSNRDASFSDNLFIELGLAYPFNSVFGEEYIEEIGVLTGYQSGDESTIVKYRVKVDNDVVSGTYPLIVKAYSDSEEYIINKEIYVDIESKDSAEIIYINTVELEPGNTTPVEFTIYNVGSSVLRDLTFSWENEDEAILPVGSGNSRYIKYLGVGESYKLVYNVIADSEADPGLYKLDLSLSYDDPLTNELKIISTNAGMYIGGGTNFEVAFSEVEGTEYSFTVANIGTNNANSVSVVVPEQNGWSFVGSNTELVGNLNKGDYTIASFDLQKFSSDNEIIIDVVYTDTKGIRKSIEKSISLGSIETTINNTNRYINQAPNGQSKNGMREMSGGLGTIMITMKWVGIGIIVLIAGIVGFKIYKKKKKNNKKK